MKNKFKFILLSVICFMSLCGCDANNGDNVEETREYDDYLGNYISLDNFYHSNERYGVYLFGKYCSFCNDIKTSVFNYADSINNGDKHNLDNFYFFEFQSNDSDEGQEQRSKFKIKPDDFNAYSDEQKNKLIESMLKAKPTKLSETYFLSTPSIYVIDGGVLVDVIRGSNSIPNWLKTH